MSLAIRCTDCGEKATVAAKGDAAVLGWVFVEAIVRGEGSAWRWVYRVLCPACAPRAKWLADLVGDKARKERA